MKKKFIVLITLILITIIATILISNVIYKGNPVLNVIIKDNENNLKYLTILDNGKTKTIDEFNNIEFSKYSIDCTKFDSKIKNNKIYNSVNGSIIYDIDGKAINNPIIKDLVLKILSNIHHEIYYLDIFELDGKVYSFVKLNVNWNNPCYLYEYDTINKRIKKLYVWQNVDLVGIGNVEK